jgi:hypothetical protein
VGETEAASGECLRRQDILILKSLPGIGRINLAALLRVGPIHFRVIGPAGWYYIAGFSSTFRISGGKVESLHESFYQANWDFDMIVALPGHG